jgi:hypothetical protein
MAQTDLQGLACGQCGTAILELPNTPVDARVLCPSCGSTSRAIAVHFEEEVRLSDHLSALQERKGEAIGFSESERQSRSSSATLQDDALLDMAVVGSSPQGEEDTRTACQILKERLNADGGNWDKIVRGCEPADCVLVDGAAPNRTLEIQVVRAVASQYLWRKLNSTGSVQSALSPADAATELRNAIDRKARDTKIPRQLRSNLVLALDSTRLPGLAFDAVVREFRSTHLDWLRKHGFAAVWLVGPVSRLVWRLD